MISEIPDNAKLSPTKLSNVNMKFVQKINPLTGHSGWELMDENYDYHQEIAQSMYADMLHDTDRNEKYYLALKKAIDKKHTMGLKANVLDIGTGTGLLSMMAAKCKADSIVACEGFPPIAAVAKKVIEDNCFSYDIKVVSKRSTELKVGPGCDLEFKANILVTEVFDTELIGEGAVETFNHANEHLLEEDAIIIPWSSKVYVIALESSLLASCNRVPDVINVENNQQTSIVVPEEIVTCPGNAGVHDLQLSQVPKKSIKLMSKPLEVFQFDFSKKININETTKQEFECIEDGGIDSFGMFWKLDMDPEGEHVISCSPSFIEESPWRDHWMQAVYHLPKRFQVKKGETVSLTSKHDEFSMCFHLEKQNEVPTEAKWPACTCGLHSITSRTRLYAMNDQIKHSAYLKVLKSLPSNSTILFLGEVSFIPLAVAKIGARKVYCIENNPFSYRIMKIFIERNKLIDKVELLDTYDKKLIKDKIDFVLAEPYFRDSILPWDGAKFWFLGKDLAPDAKFLPSKLRIVGMSMEFEHLHKIRSPLVEVSGFRMDSFDKLIQNSSDRANSDVEVQPLWEYPGKSLTKPEILMEFDLNENTPTSRLSQTGDISFTNEGLCHGVALWAEWDFGNATINSGISADGTWDMGSRQGVYFNRNPCRIEAGTSMSYEVSLSPQIGLIYFKFAFPQL